MLGDSLGAGIVNHLSKQELTRIPANVDLIAAKTEGGGENGGVEATAM